MIVYKTTDKLPVQIGKLTVYVAPLTALQYSNVMAVKSSGLETRIEDGVKMALKTLKYAIKDLKAEVPIEYADGSEFKLEFDNSELADSSLDALVQILGPAEMTVLANRVILNDFELPVKGAKIEESTSKKKA